jgi:uncharacterized membrane protein YwzB
MALRTQKSLGYILLFVGLICIFIAFRSMQDIFNQETYPPEIFQTKSVSFSMSGDAGVPPTTIKVALDSDIRKTVNICLYYMFMFLVVIIGGRVSSLGIQLIKEKKQPKAKEPGG